MQNGEERIAVRICGRTQPPAIELFRQQKAELCMVPRRLAGRMEKRIPIATIVYLEQADQKLNDEAELTYTDNLSAHGACVVTKHRWEVGKTVEVTSLQDQTTLCGKVVHCEKRGDNRYYIGLSFLDHGVTWSTFETSNEAESKRDGNDPQCKPLVTSIASD